MSGQRKPMTMVSILDSCAGAKRQDFPPGTILLTEGETSGRLYVLAEGTVEVLRGDKQVALIKGAGSIFGEMSVLLNRPHTATVLTATPVGAFVFDDAESFLKSHPEIAFFLGRLLAERLNAATTYLVDLKRQFEPRHRALERLTQADVLIARRREPQRLASIGVDDDMRRRRAELLAFAGKGSRRG
jgi:CRP/FNR family cyclic AMP-dependent transcriptional regulator